MRVLEQPSASSPGDAGPSVVIVDDHAVVRAGLRLVLEGDGVQVLGDAGDLEQARELVARTSTVVLTMQNEAAFGKEALAAGARAYVLKDGAFSELLSAVTAAAAGGHYVSPELGARLAVNDGSAHLSPRELEVLRL